MDIFRIRTELTKMDRKELFKLVFNQKISKCLIGGRTCGFYLAYKEFSFCVSEILGQSCQLEKLRKLEEVYQEPEKINFSLALINEMEPELPGKKSVEFKVCYKHGFSRQVVFLGKVIERRKKERGDNLRDLLNKAVRDFSGQVKDPSTIFLLGP
jgi:hypothetical protein